MNRITSREQEEIISKKENKTVEENIYLKLAKFENKQEENNLFTKSQVNMIVKKSAEVLADVIKNKITKEILLTLLNVIKTKAVDGKIEYVKIEKIAYEIIKCVTEEINKERR